MTTGCPAKGPPGALRLAMYMMPRATTEDHPKPGFLSTLTGMTLALGAVPLIEMPKKL